MGVQHGVEPVDPGIEKLLAQVGRGVDQHAGDAAGPLPLDQQRGPPPAVPGIVRIAGAPAERRARNAAGGAAAEIVNVSVMRAGDRALGRGTLRNRRRNSRVVWRAISSSDTPRVSASTLAVSTT